MRGRRDLSRIRALMDEENIDIGVLQEMETRPSRGGTEQDIHVVAGEARPHHLPGFAMVEGRGWYGNLVVSRYPVTRGQVHNLGTSPHLEPRNAVDALIETPLGPLRVIGTHLSLSRDERRAEARRLRSLVDSVEEGDKSPFLLMGDINEWHGGAGLLRHLSEIMTPLQTARTFPSAFPLFRLDRVWAGHMPWPVRAARLKNDITRVLSDHLPVIVDLG